MRRVLTTSTLPLPPSNAIMADLVADAVGVNTHFSFDGTPYTNSYSNCRTSLINLGTRHIRENSSPGDTTFESRLRDLASVGLKSLMINWNASDYSWVSDLNSAGTVVEAVEPANEQDGSWSALCSQQTSMWTNYRQSSNSRLNTLPILGPSLANGFRGPEFASACSTAGSHMDAANIHDYSGSAPESPVGGGYGQSLLANFDAQRSYLGSVKPIWSTENGYSTDGDQYVGSTLLGAAKYAPRQVLYHILNNSPRVYFYELCDDLGQQFGLVNANFSPRPIYTALQSLITLLRDPGPLFTTTALPYTLTGDKTNIKTALVQKRNGVYYLCVWQSIYVTNPSVGGTSDLNNPNRNLTLTLPTVYTIRTYLPSTNGTTVLTTDHTSSLGLSVPDHVLIVEVSP